MKRQLRTVVMAVLVLGTGSVLAEVINGVDIDFVNIGNAGYAADAATSYGFVGYNYRIGTTEVTIDQFAASGLGSGSGDQPVVNMTWHTAAQYANWLTSADINVGAYTISGGTVTAIDRSFRNGNGQVYLLPTENEWYKAAYFTGSGYSLYANGSALAPVQNGDANYGQGEGDPTWGNTSPWTVGTGSMEQNGTYDMGGNVWEWLESTYGGEAYNPGDSNQKMAFHGGDAEQYIVRLQATDRTYDLRGNAYGLTGIRIVAIPEPGTISLMSLSTISLFATRRIRRRKQAGKTLFPIGREHVCDAFEERVVYGEADGDYLTELARVFKASFLVAWSQVHARYKDLDKMFWNHMVVSHERRVVRRNSFRVSFKKKLVGGFDTFLSLIMK